MQCPVDSTTLLMSDRQGVEIDYCPQCRGVWLDRGELDKLIERSDDDDDRGRGDDREPRGRGDDREPRQSGRSDEGPGDGRSYGQPKKKKRWLSEMFEFD